MFGCLVGGKGSVYGTTTGRVKYFHSFNMCTFTEANFRFRGPGPFWIGGLSERFATSDIIKFVLHVLATFTVQVVPIHKHITVGLLHSEFPRYQEQKQSQRNKRKRQRWSYLTTLTLHIYWIPHWPRESWKMDSGVFFHTLCVTKTNSQRHKKRLPIVIHFNLSRSFVYSKGSQSFFR